MRLRIKVQLSTLPATYPCYHHDYDARERLCIDGDCSVAFSCSVGRRTAANMTEQVGSVRLALAYSLSYLDRLLLAIAHLCLRLLSCLPRVLAFFAFHHQL